MFLLDPSRSLSLRTRVHRIRRYYVKIGFGSPLWGPQNEGPL